MYNILLVNRTKTKILTAKLLKLCNTLNSKLKKCMSLCFSLSILFSVHISALPSVNQSTIIIMYEYIM